MPIRFSTEAANADFLRDDAESAGVPQGVGADGMPGEPSERRPKRETRPAEAKGETKPRKDTNAGIVSDESAGKS